MAVDWTRDEIILACALISEHEWRGVRADQKAVQELSALLRRAPIHPVSERDEAFRSPNSVQRKTFDIATQHPDYGGRRTKGNKLDRVVLLEFLAEPERMRTVAGAIHGAIVDGLVKRTLSEEIAGQDMAAPEGTLLLSRHLVRERDPRLRRAKLQQVSSSGKRLLCEVCAFDFEHMYGALGRGYIEVHHRLPLHASGPTTTRLADLVLLCSNCHRMIHRSKDWLTPEELGRRVSGRGNPKTP